jgi:hypothetical protein
MPGSNVWDVEPRNGGRTWAVQREGTVRADSLHDNKDTAIERGRELGRRYNGQLRIKGRDGRIQDSAFYGDRN